MRPFDQQYYMKMFRSLCAERRASKLLFPLRHYIVQVARFDPAKGIPDVIRSYVKARQILDDKIPGSKHPQLVLVGHGAVDDPDATIIFDQIMDLLEEEDISPFAADIIVVRLPPSDQCILFIVAHANNSAQCNYVERNDCIAIVFARGI
jgi:glycosyltransferase involved in cell wall biosynthesis